jgi:uroporphyrinogen-III decarboxylase
MAPRNSIPLAAGFYPDWWHKHYGISFDKKYYFDPETRIEARLAMDKALHQRFGDVGMGDPDPQPKPMITAGMITLPAIFGCEIVYQDDALPWAVPLNLSDDEVMKLDVPDVLHSWPMTEWIRQIDYLKEKFGTVVGDINTTGIQNLALKIRGDQLYIDYFENPDLCHHLLRICTECVKRLFEFNFKTTGTGAVDVTPMAAPEIAVIPNCTEEQVSNNIYETFLLRYDNEVAEAVREHGFGIHHCGSVNEVLRGYAKVRHLKFIEIGFGSDVKSCRETLGPQVAVNARISPVLMKNGTSEEVAAEVKKLIDQGAPMENFSIDTVGLTYGTPDENVKTARRTAQEYGRSTPPSNRRKPWRTSKP